MTFFIIVVIYNLGKVFFRTFKPCFIKGYIASNSKNIRVKVFTLVFLFLKLLFGLFLSLLKGFYIARGIIYGFRLLELWLSLLNLRVFYGSILNLYFGYDDMNKTITLLGLVVYLLNIKNRLEVYFGLNFDHFLNYFFPNIQFSTSLLYLYLYKEFKALLEEFNKIGLF